MEMARYLVEAHLRQGRTVAELARGKAIDDQRCQHRDSPAVE